MDIDRSHLVKGGYSSSYISGKKFSTSHTTSDYFYSKVLKKRRMGICFVGFLFYFKPRSKRLTTRMRRSLHVVRT